jgi:hypothetical protein
MTSCNLVIELLTFDWPDTRYSEIGLLIKIICTGLRRELPQPGWEYWSTVKKTRVVSSAARYGLITDNTHGNVSTSEYSESASKVLFLVLVGPLN